MRLDPPSHVAALLRAAAALLAAAAIAAYAYRSLGTHLWMDELLTIRLTMSESLPKLWSGIAVGIDGNPPLYLTLAWLLVHAISDAVLRMAPGVVSDIAVLRVVNIAVVMTAIVVLARTSLRLATPLAAWIAGFLFVMLNANVEVLAFDLRTYASYFLAAVIAVLLQQRLIERGRGIDAVWLSLSYAALVLSHNFGIVYVACIAVSGLLSQWPRIGETRWRTAKLTAAAVAAAAVVLACWLPVFARQSETGRPYLWISAPDLAQLLTIVFSSPLAMVIGIVEAACLAAAAAVALHTGSIAALRAWLRDPGRQFSRYVMLLAVGISAITLAVWLVARTIFPIFVPRYLVPQLIVSFALHVAFCEWLLRALHARFKADPAKALPWAAVTLPILFSLTLLRGPMPAREPCTDVGNIYFEAKFIDGTLPVIASSPHVFLPRQSYGTHPDAYRFPLDWDVVLTYPQRSRGNATEFHVMQRLGAWQPDPSIMTTDQIVAAYPQFLVIAASDQAWFDHLRQTHDVAATRLAEVSAAGAATCTLWKVDSVKPMP